MPRIIETTIYDFSELSARAKDRARDWFREGTHDDDWYDAVFEDFERVCALLGVTLTTRPVALYGGCVRDAPCIWFSRFSSQGDGASFEGRYEYAPASVAALRDYAPVDKRLHDIATALARVQRRNFYSLRADISQRGRYVHACTMDVAVSWRGTADRVVADEAVCAITDALRDLATWLYRQLETEWDYRQSDGAVDETIEANSYAFLEDGRYHG